MLTVSGNNSWKSRVLIVTNSDVALSDTIADYYIAQHGLVSHKLAYAFGTNMNLQTTGSDTLLAGVINNAAGNILKSNGAITGISDYCAANDIKIVLCSAGVPEYCYTLPNAGAHRNPMSVSSVIAAAQMLVAMNDYPLAITPNDTGPPTNCPTNLYSTAGAEGRAPVMSSLTEPNIGNATHYTCRIPTWHDNRSAPSVPAGLTSLLMIGGRIGIPGSAAMFSGVNEDLVTTKRIIDDAVATEGNTGPVVLVINEYSTGVADGIEYSRRLLQAAKYNVRHCKSGTLGSLAVPAASFDITAFEAGTLTPKEPAWLVLEGAAGLGLWVSSVIPQRGSSAYSWWSGGMHQGMLFLQAGGCCAAGSWNEPWASGLTPTSVFMEALLKGITYSEAVFAYGATKLAWNMTVWGDPLYRPFAKRKLPGGFPKIENTENQ